MARASRRGSKVLRTSVRLVRSAGFEVLRYRPGKAFLPDFDDDATNDTVSRVVTTDDTRRRGIGHAPS
jgi:hypothetical protein